MGWGAERFGRPLLRLLSLPTWVLLQRHGTKQEAKLNCCGTGLCTAFTILWNENTKERIRVGRLILKPTISLIKASLKTTRQWLKTKNPQQISQQKKEEKKRRSIFLRVRICWQPLRGLGRMTEDSNRRTPATAVLVAASVLPVCHQFATNFLQM